MTPAAYDLRLDVSIPEGVGIRDVYGVPDYVPGTRGARITVPTVFFSRREGSGGVILRLTFITLPTFEQTVSLGQLKLWYTLADGRQRRSAFSPALPAGLSPVGERAYFSDDSARRACLLLDTALVLRDAADAIREDRAPYAATMLDEFLTYFDAASQGLSDRTDRSSRRLSDERDLVEALLGTAGGYYGF